MIEKQSDVRKQQTETAGKVVLENMSKAKKKQQKDFIQANNKKRKFNEIHVGARVLKFNASRAARKAKGNLETNYTGPYVVDSIKGNVATLKTMSGQVLKTGVSLNNLKIFVESAMDSAVESAVESAEESAVESALESAVESADKLLDYVKELAKLDIFESLGEKCSKLQSGVGRVNIGNFTEKLSACPVSSFINEVSAENEEMVDDFLQAMLQVLEAEVTKTAKFTEACLLLCTVLAHAFINQLNPVEVIETLEKMPSFIVMPQEVEQLREGERMTVAGEGVAKDDVETLAADSWLNDKIINAYLSLLAREMTDSWSPQQDSHAKVFFMPAQTAEHWPSGDFTVFPFLKVDFNMYDILMLPQCKGNNHWVLLVANVKSRSVTIYDSLSGNNMALFDLFCQFMCQRAQIVKDGLEKWEFEAPPCIKQRDGNSCGVFALMTAECLVRKKHPTMLRQPHVLGFRDYVRRRLLFHGVRQTYLCDSLHCKDPHGIIEWIACDVCKRWLHEVCVSQPLSQDEDSFVCDVCIAQYS
ncbi:hypothetical protein DPMN_058987 [Dreissena polymorpha]|uniref:Ubiquitin-like protease family profile domain-containing protein n=2 Tax=Dreissena polymorpha TaxID=45954 RepID=A0A9D4HG48_DREPO|nr:hypothetical protein DPMN_058987 [Dreissena polymorpha]